MSQVLYKRMYDCQSMDRAHKRAMSGRKKYRKESVLFNMCSEVNLMNLRKKIRDKTYEPGEYGTLIVHEPKERVVHYPKLEDKLVQYEAHEILREIYKPVFIRDSYACQLDKGTHDAVYKIQHNMRFVKWKYGDAWVVKLDIRKFYYRIDREVVKELLRKKIPDTESDFLELMYKIIDSSPEADGRGLPLGNVSSQDDANIVGNEIDQFAVRYKHWKYYVRFADDIVVVVPTREEAKETLRELEDFISSRLHLETNEKTRIFPVEQGVKALGYRIYTTHLLLQDGTIRHMKARMKAIDEKVQSGELTKRQAQHEVNAWLGHARVANAYRLCEKIFAPYPYIKFDRDDWRFGEKSPNKRKKYQEKLEAKKLNKKLNKNKNERK